MNKSHEVRSAQIHFFLGGGEQKEAISWISRRGNDHNKIPSFLVGVGTLQNDENEMIS